MLFLYTPLKEYVIDDASEKSEKNIILLSSKIDSLSMLLEKNDLYIESLKTILNGGSPTKVKEEEKIPAINKNLNLINSEKDSLFRLFVEKKSAGDYILSSSNNTTHFFSPLVGSFTEKYNLSENHFGVDIVSLEGSFICSIAD